MSLEQELATIEERLWTGGPDAYRNHLDDECLVAFTGMAGVSTREEIAGTAAGGRWRDLEIDVKGLVRPSDDVAILTYEASAARDGAEEYRALVSSGYARRDGAWKLVFHQQAPLGES